MPAHPPPETINPIVEAISHGDAPLPLKLSAARGVLPLSRPDHVQVLVMLLNDTSEAVRVEADGCLAAISQKEILKLLEDTATPPMILDHFGRSETAGEEYRAAVLSNSSTSSGTLIKMAPLMTTEQIDELITRQGRLIEAPELLTLLAANPQSTEAHRMRFDEIRKHFLDQATPAIAPKGAPQPEPAPEVQPQPEPETESALPAGEIEKVDEEIEAPTLKISRLTTAEKVKLAYTASKEERAILIKDSSKIIQVAVLDSPKLTDREVENFAKMRSVNEEVLRIIARNRDWMKNYVIAHALATNPKTPVAISMSLVPRFSPRDLRLAVVDRNIPDAVRRHAKKISEKRTRGGRV